jgi:WD40 repeat protein
MTLSLQLNLAALPAQSTLKELVQKVQSLDFLNLSLSPDKVLNPPTIPVDKEPEVERAIDELFNSLLGVTKLTKEEMGMIYQTVFLLFPYFKDKDIKKFLRTAETVSKKTDLKDEAKGVLEELLYCSPLFKREQQRIALFLAFWWQRHIPSLPFSTGLLIYQNSMCYLAKAIKIAQFKGDVLSARECHCLASQLVLNLLKNHHFKENRFRDRLDRAANGCHRPDERGISTVFSQVFSLIEEIKRFCIQEDDKKIVNEAYFIVANTISNLSPMTREKYKGYGVASGELRIQHFSLSTTYVTEDYSKKLEEYRKNFYKFSSIKDPTMDQVRRFQTEIFLNLRSLFDVFLKDAFNILGPPSCGYSIQCMGSVGREEPCPYSDLEFFILYEKEEYDDENKIESKVAYFKNLIHVLSFLLMSLDETPHLKLNFSCVETKNPSGLHIDEGVVGESSLIGTPEILALIQNQEVEPGSHPQTLRQSITLATNDPQLFKSYHNERMVLLKAHNNMSSDSLSPIFRQLLASDVSLTLLDIQNEDPLLAEKLRKYFYPNKLALKLLECRLKEYKITWKTPSFEILHMKKHYVEILHLLLADMAIYYNLSATNVLDIIDQLASRGVISPKANLLLKQAASFIYALRVRIHLAYQEQKEEVYRQSDKPSDYILKAGELFHLQRYYWLLLRPLYHALASALKKADQEVLLFDKLNLIDQAFDEAIAIEDRNISKQMIRHLAIYLQEMNEPDAVHEAYFKKLSLNSEHEPLRQVYFQTIEEFSSQNTNLIDCLAQIPNSKGLRYAFQRDAEKLLHSLLNLTTPEPIKNTPEGASHPVTEVRVTGSSIPEVFLKPEVISKILDNEGNIQDSYPGSIHAHKVCAMGSVHFKQKPTHPLMEYAIHNLLYRLGGNLTPSTLLVRFEVTIKGKKKVYPVLISQTIPGQTLKEAFKKDIQLTGRAWARWTWMIFGSMLTRPGDGRFSNYVMDKLNYIYCIDNDISFVEPILQEGPFKKIYFSSALFCLWATTPLDKNVLKEFHSLNVDLILEQWIEDVIHKEQEYLSLFTEQEREQLYNEDPNNRFKATILFREGALATLNLQFCYLQNQLSSLILKETDITSIDLLRMLVNVREKPSADNSIGEYIHRAYKKALALSSQEDRLKQVTSRPHDKSLSSVQSDRAIFGKIPAYAEIEKLQFWTPSKAKEELLATMLYRLNQSLSFITHGTIHGKKTLRISFKEITLLGKPDIERQKLILQGITILAHLEKDKLASIGFVHCDVLNSESLDPFLTEKIEYIDLIFCPEIVNRSLEKIQEKCPKLLGLQVRGCPKVKSIAKQGIISNDPLRFPQLERLQIEQNATLVDIRLQAPRLKVLTVKHHEKLNLIELQDLTCFPEVNFSDNPELDLEKFYQGINPVRIFLNLIEKKMKEDPFIFDHPFHFILCALLGDHISQEIIKSGYVKTLKKFIEPLFYLIERSKTEPRMATTAANAITILNFAHIPFSGKDFRGIRIPYANLARAYLVETDLREADVIGSNLSGANLARSRLAGVNMDNVQLDKVTHVDMPLRSSQKTNNDMSAVLLIPNKNILISAEDEKIRIWDARTGLELQRLEGHTAQVTHLSFFKNSNKLASSSKDGTIRIWNLDTSKEINRLRVSGPAIEFLGCIEKPERIVISCTKDQFIHEYLLTTNVQILDIRNNQILKNYYFPRRNHIDTLIFPPIILSDTKFAIQSATGSALIPNYNFVIQDIETDEELVIKNKAEDPLDSLHQLEIVARANHLILINNMQFAYVYENEIYVQDIEKRTRSKKLQRNNFATITALASLNEGSILVVATTDPLIYIKHVTPGFRECKISTASQIKFLFTSEPDLIYAADEKGKLWCWRIDIKKNVFSILWTHHFSLNCENVEIDKIQNLSEINRQIMLASGAIDTKAMPPSALNFTLEPIDI